MNIARPYLQHLFCYIKYVEKAPFNNLVTFNFSNFTPFMFIVHLYSKDIKVDGYTHYRDSILEVMNEIED